MLGLVIIVGAGLAWKFDRGITDGIAAGITAAASASAWIPCVGPDLGGLLNSDWNNPIANLPGTAAFLLGQFLPFVLVGAGGLVAPQAAKRLERPKVIAAGAILLAIFGLSFVTQQFDELAYELARRSNADLLG